ncbi:hypothetical protein AXK60_07665 [Tsukamurella pseudospumae]|uniref:DUF7373 domain-containing protein n=1 Tax=Tsukamurella pseudospumae TaxID=239498 RepID=A0A138AJ27_9ACTN|nr:hypothetical protein AXK61_15840 [Tsukamurella pseudospumae]KXP10327.1 hypothetical protein AXK60_07665 [Tsukamurella pseudospumae]
MAILVAGCTPIAGTAVPDPTAMKRFQLNTGNFSTTPRTVTAGNALDAWQQEGWRIASAVVPPWDVDTTLGTTGGGDGSSIPMFTATQLIKTTDAVTAEQAVALGANGYQTGYLASSHDTADRTRLRIGILRFADEAAATRAVAAATAKSPSNTRTVPSDFPVPGASLTLLGTKSNETIVGITTMVPRGNLVAIAGVRAAGTRDDTDRLLALVGRALAAQVAKLGDYRQTPFDATRAEIPPVPMDDDGIVGLTQEPKQAQGSTGLSSNNAPGSGWGDAHAYSLRGHETVSGLERFGSAGPNTVYRFTDEASAARIFTSWVGDKRETIPGITGQYGGCVTGQVLTICLIRQGRYIAESVSQTSDASKQLSAAMFLKLRSAK